MEGKGWKGVTDWRMDYDHSEVSWSLTSLSAQIWLYQKQKVESYPYPVKEGQWYINLNPGHLFVQQPPKKGKGSRGSCILLH